MIKLSFIYLMFAFLLFGSHSVTLAQGGDLSQNLLLAQEEEGEFYDDPEQYEEPEDDVYEDEYDEYDEEEYDDLEEEETEEELEDPYYPEEPVEEEVFEEQSQI